MDILDVIGNTSLVPLRRVVPPGGARVFVKLEWENPTGSMKDRMALAAIARAGADGRLKPGDTVGQGATVVTLLVDSGLKYLGTDLYRDRDAS
jgi:cysteine synthase A